MAVHDWTRVSAVIFHDLHVAWIVELSRALNCGVLPQDYYSLAEPASTEPLPEILTPTELRQSEAALLAARRRRLVIRHTTDDRIVALIEIVSPGNKENKGALQGFVDNAIGALEAGYHLLVVDLFPPGFSDPSGIHGAIWKRLGGGYEPAPGKPLTLAAYVAERPVKCHVEPTAVGSELIPTPLFLDPDSYVYVPLEQTCMAAYVGVPRRWKQVIEKGD
jgi:hypothetical protein